MNNHFDNDCDNNQYPKMPQFNINQLNSTSNHLKKQKPVNNNINNNNNKNNKILFNKKISKLLTASIEPIMSRGIRLLQKNKELDLKDFTYNLELVDEFQIRIKLTNPNGWNNTILVALPLKTNSLQVEIGPKTETATFLVKSPVSFFSAGLGPQNIPRIIHQTFIQQEVSKKMYETSLKWSKLNPEYEYRFYDNKDCRDIIKNNFKEDVLNAYDTLLPGAYKSDLWRACILYLYGGVYIDIAMEPLIPLRDIIEYNINFILTRDTPAGKSYLYNAFIGIIPKHPIILLYIKKIVLNVEKRWYGGKDDYLLITGPGLLGKSVNIYLGNNENKAFDLGIIDINKKDKFLVLEHLNKTNGIYYNNVKLINTKYEGYKQDRGLMAGAHYSELYNSHLIYCNLIKNNPATETVNGNIQSDIINCIYQTFSTKYVSTTLYEKHQSWIQKNPEYYYYFYDYDSHLNFIADHFGERVTTAYNRLASIEAKVNLWKYCILYTKGGVFSNIDSQCNMPLRFLINNKINFIFVADTNFRNLRSSFIATMSKNPIMLKMILEIVKLTETLNYDTIDNKEDKEILIAGPSGLETVIRDLLEYEENAPFIEGLYKKFTFTILILSYDNISNSLMINNNAVIRESYSDFNREMLLYK